MHPEALRLATVMCSPDLPPETQMPFECILEDNFGQDWIAAMQFVIDVCYACLMLLNNLPHRGPQSRDEVAPETIPVIIDRIEQVTGVRLIVNDVVEDSYEFLACNYFLFADKDIPVSKWYFVDKVLQFKMQFLRFP